MGVIGCGQIASAVHLPVLKAMGFEVCWIVDPNPEAIREIANVFQAKTLSDPEQLAYTETPEVIVIACPYGVRESYYRVLRKCHLESAILVEKPVALTTKEHDDIVSLRDLWMVGGGYNRRSSPQLLFVKRILKSDVFGPLHSVDFQYGYIGNKTSGKYTASLELAGGGPLFDTGVHGIDSVLFLTDGTDATVDNVCMKRDAGFDVHTSASMQIQTEGSKVPFALKVTLLDNTSNCIRLYFETCVLEFSLFGKGVKVTSKQDGTEIKLSPPLDPPEGSHVKECLFWRDFLKAIREGKCNYTSLVQSRLTTSVIESLYAKGGEAS